MTGMTVTDAELMRWVEWQNRTAVKQDQDTWLRQTPPAGWWRKRGTDRPTDRPTKPFVGQPPGSGKDSHFRDNRAVLTIRQLASP